MGDRAVTTKKNAAKKVAPKKASKEQAAERASTGPAEQHSPRSARGGLPKEVELVIERFRVRARSRVKWLDYLWSRSRPEGSAGAGGALAIVFDDRDSPAKEAAFSRRDEEAQQKVAHIEAELAGLKNSRFATLTTVLGLTPADRDLLEACVALALDPSLARVCAFLNESPSRPFVTEAMASRIYLHGRHGVWNAESAVYRWQLVHERESNPGEPHALECDEQIREWLIGKESLDPSLIGVVALQPVLDPIASWPVEQTVSSVQGALNRGGRLQVSVTGAPGSGRKSFAAAVSAKLGLPLLAVDCDQIEESAWRAVYERVQRHAFLERSAIAWAGDALARRRWPRTTPAFPLQFAISEAAQQPLPPAEFVTAQVAMPALTASDRETLWRTYVPEIAEWPENDLRELNERYRVTPGDIALVSRASPHNPAEVRQNVQVASREKFGGLASPLECSFGWDDLVLDAVTTETLKDIAFEAAHRTVYWEQPAPQRLFPQGRGLTVLLSGPPGTGKTMSAQVIAAELRYDLIRVEMPSMVSKYVGETSQNVERLLQRARLSNVIVLFDEADAFFAKRVEDTRDAQDRHVNTESAYLLQAIEAFPGVTFLSTNQKGNIDSAFFRRLRFVVDYQKPDAAQRLTIWRKVTGELLGRQTLDAIQQSLEQIAESVEVTGAQIKNALLGALFIAQREGTPIRARHIAHSLHRELAKSGRALGTRERERLSRP